jgi:predicted transcriptional regulator
MNLHLPTDLQVAPDGLAIQQGDTPNALARRALADYVQEQTQLQGAVAIGEWSLSNEPTYLADEAIALTRQALNRAA